MSESSPGSGFVYRAFISYSHRDKAWADWLHKALEAYRVPSRLVGTHTAHGSVPRRLNPIFRDRDELASAHDLGCKVNAALAQSANLIVICSPHSAASRWVNEEVLAFKRLGRTERIFCVIVDGEPNAADKADAEIAECFVPALRFQIDAHGQPTAERAEPIAADARPGKDGKADAKLKLIAGMLDVGFDALKQREQHRKLQRMAVVTGLAVTVMAITAVLAAFALVSRREALIAQQAAERRQKQAEGLVNFMLGDLNDKLEQVSRLDIMQGVDDKAMAYFKSLPTADVTEEALAQRAKALEKIGTVRMDQGQLPGALAAYRASIQVSSQLAAAAPLDVTRQVAYSRTLAYIGMTYWKQGDLAAAQHEFESAQQVLRHFQGHAHADPRVLSQLEYLSNNIGHVLEARGQLASAAKAYRSALDSSEKLVAAQPQNTDWKSELGGAHNNLGKLALIDGDLATAIAQYAADEKIESALSAGNPRDNYQNETTLTVRAILGRTLALAGDDQAGLRHLGQAVQMAEKLVQVDPANAGFQDDLALYSIQLARLQRLNGGLAAAKKLTARSLALLTVLVRKDPTNGYFQSDAASARLEQAAESLADGRSHAANVQVQAALRSLEPLLAKQPDDRGLLLARLEAQLLLARTSSVHVAAVLRDTVVKAAQAQRSGRNDPRLLALQVEALLGLEREPDARPLIAQLWETGYRDAALVATLQRHGIPYPVNTSFLARLPPGGIAVGDPRVTTRRRNRDTFPRTTAHVPPTGDRHE
ncbi:MAG: toll/interleukin-1 receptor domain-containing protein [Rhodanobacteraceae bacterium]|nr:MAG: toll/interleukin-1 receptor domain-containing protein [Rhodanobacteraceae bacterium]